MEQWATLRRKLLVDGIRKRQILRETGMHWQTLEKILTHSQPPGYRRTKPHSSKLDAHHAHASVDMAPGGDGGIIRF